MKLLTTAVFAVLLSISGFTLTAGIPTFKTCLQKENPLSCSAEQYEDWKNKLREKLQSSVPHIEDSIYLRYEVGHTKVKISENFTLSSKSQLDKVVNALNSLHSELNVPDTNYTYELIITTKLADELKNYPDLEEVQRFPTVENCTDFNLKGRKGCFRYLASYTNTQLKGEGWKGLGNFNIYFTQGKLSAVKVNKRFLDPFAHDRLVAYFKENYHTYVTENPGPCDNFKITTEIRTISDSTERYEFSMNRLRAEAQRPGNTYFLENLFDMANSFYLRTESQKKAHFIKTQLSAQGLRDSTYRVSGKLYRMDSIYSHEDRGYNESLHFGMLERVPVYNGCNADDDNEKLKSCFNQQIMRHVAKNFRFPDEARQKGIQGKTYIKFEIDSTGVFRQIDVIRPAHPLLDFEGIRQISLIPDAVAPAFHHNKAVRTSFVMPINAKLR